MSSQQDTYTADLFHDAAGSVIVENAPSTATFSPCLQYRYELWRRWRNDLPYCMVIGLNPSTANEIENDRTIAKLIRLTRKWGYGGLCMTNLFAYRATEPANMKKQADPVGPENDSYLRKLSVDAGMVLAAWGTHGKHLDRAAAVMALLPAEVKTKLRCLSVNDDGSPGHPLYLPDKLVPVPFPHQKQESPADEKAYSRTEIEIWLRMASEGGCDADEVRVMLTDDDYSEATIKALLDSNGTRAEIDAILDSDASRSESQQESVTRS